MRHGAGDTGKRNESKGRLSGGVGERMEAAAVGSQAAGCELRTRVSLSKILRGTAFSGEKGFLDSLKCAGFKSYSIPGFPYVCCQTPAGPLVSSSTADSQLSSQMSTARREVLIFFPEVGILLFSHKSKKKIFLLRLQGKNRHQAY